MVDLLIYSAEFVGLFKQEKQAADSRTYSCSLACRMQSE